MLVCLLGFATPVLLAAQEESAWVSDQFEIMLRTGPSTNNSIQLMLGSGTRLEVLENDPDSGYSRVRTAGGTEGWVLSRYLMAEPAAREQLAALAGELSSARASGGSVGEQLSAVQGEYKSARRRIAKLEREKTQLEAELGKIKRTAADTLAIDSQNGSLRQQLADAEIRASVLQQENATLASGATRNWFITGALVVFGGVVLGLILPRLSFRRRARYDSF